MKDSEIFLNGIDNEIEALTDWNKIQKNPYLYLRPMHGKEIPSVLVKRMLLILRTYLEVEISALLALFIILFKGNLKLPSATNFFFYRKKRFEVFKSLSTVKAKGFCHSLNFLSVHKDKGWNDNIIFYLPKYSVLFIVTKSILLLFPMTFSFFKNRSIKNFMLAMPTLGRIVEFYINEEMIRILPSKSKFFTEEWLMRQGVWFTEFCIKYSLHCTIIQHGALQKRYLPHHLNFDEFYCYPCSKELFEQDYGKASKYIETWEILDILNSTQNYISYDNPDKFKIGFASQGMHTKRSIELLEIICSLFEKDFIDNVKVFIYAHPNEPEESFESLLAKYSSFLSLTKERHDDLDLLITQYSTIALEYLRYFSDVKVIVYPPKGIDMDFFSMNNLVIVDSDEMLKKYIRTFV